ncbi:LytR/AlgR family response regulator transcription factor [Natranaerobius trueperi]|uniref:Stage 0 sporulation protein A homolog n=1 Tax=Natranaerobius trueperi TaxID=759412 RepID=A0A226C040_9FIRM|nr:LytTR family DNA-binding domain-containing protein [Natranaerobius trueperi]OWZ84633.1 hypothetical protein CDO51_02410 [Natranaerobius trueperi]
MKNVKILILEDEKFTRRFLKSFISGNCAVSKVIDTEDGDNALRLVKEYSPHIGIIDIELLGQKINGLTVAKAMKKVKPDMEFIFVTAYSEYALKSFEVHPFDYLVKPISQGRLKSSINELIDKMKGQNHFGTSSKLVFEQPKAILQIPIDKILFIEKTKGEKKVRIYLDDGKVHEVSKSLKEIQRRLDDDFVRSHRSYIINVTKTTKIQNISHRCYEVCFVNSPNKALVSRYNYEKTINSLVRSDPFV